MSKNAALIDYLEHQKQERSKELDKVNSLCNRKRALEEELAVVNGEINKFGDVPAAIAEINKLDQFIDDLKAQDEVLDRADYQLAVEPEPCPDAQETPVVEVAEYVAAETKEDE